MLSRQDACKLINDHLENGIKNVLPAKPWVRAGRKQPWHYGRVELNALLDAIYGGPPDPKNLREHLKAR